MYTQQTPTMCGIYLIFPTFYSVGVRPKQLLYYNIFLTDKTGSGILFKGGAFGVLTALAFFPENIPCSFLVFFFCTHIQTQTCYNNNYYNSKLIHFFIKVINSTNTIHYKALHIL